MKLVIIGGFVGSLVLLPARGEVVMWDSVNGKCTGSCSVSRAIEHAHLPSLVGYELLLQVLSTPADTCTVKQDEILWIDTGGTGFIQVGVLSTPPVRLACWSYAHDGMRYTIKYLKDANVWAGTEALITE